MGEWQVSPWAHPRPRGQPGSVAGRWHSLADVLAGEDDPARLALEAADVPLLLQGQQGLALLDLLLAAGTVWGDRRGGGTRQSSRGHPQDTHSCWATLAVSPGTPSHPAQDFSRMMMLQTPCS